MKQKYNLVGQDGNAYALMGYTMNAMRKEGYTKEQIDEVMKNAKSGDYNNLLCVLDVAIQLCNRAPIRGEYQSEEDFGRALAEYWDDSVGTCTVCGWYDCECDEK